MNSLLKPTLLKIILTFGFLIVASFLWRQYMISRISDTFPWGFPFQFYLAWGPCPPGEVCYEFKGLLLVIDLAIWYVVSGFIVTMRRKHTNE